MSEESIYDALGSTARRDGLHMLVGKPIGAGCFRKVYEYALDEERVIKIEDLQGSFKNVIEWELWRCAQETSLARWLAPCHSISPIGIFLVQSRTKPPAKSEMPRRIPELFLDTKLENWGWLGDRIVCHDYSNIRVRDFSRQGRLVSADWWSLSQ